MKQIPLLENIIQREQLKKKHETQEWKRKNAGWLNAKKEAVRQALKDWIEKWKKKSRKKKSNIFVEMQ